MHKFEQTEKSKKETAAKRSRGRPRAFDRDAALGQATHLFWSKGYEATSMTDLTQAMGIGSPSLYAAFGSKEALYAESLRYYVSNYEDLVWGKFHAAATAREAVLSLLLDSAAALTGCSGINPPGCMVTLSSVASEGYAELGELVQGARAVTLDRLKASLAKAIEEGELPSSVDTHALARFIQTVQNGMALLARDGATSAELESVAQVAIMGWDARTSEHGNAPHTRTIGAADKKRTRKR